MIRVGNFRYVSWARLDEFHRLGWMAVADLGMTHGSWSVLCWRCDCPEVPA